MTTIAIVGDPESIKGSGKTMTLAFLQYLDYKKGRKILSNVEYSFPYTQLDVIEVVEDLENDKREKYQDVSIGIDELHLIMPSGSPFGNKDDQDLLINFLYQTRKLDMDVYYVTHRAMNINHKIRGMVELQLMARKFHTKDGSHCVFDNCKEEHYIEVRNANDVDSWLSKEPIYLNPNIIGKLYPTNQLLPIMKENYWRPKQDKRTKKVSNKELIYQVEERIHEEEKEEGRRKTNKEKIEEIDVEILRLEKEEILNSEEIKLQETKEIKKKKIIRKKYEV